MKRFVFAIALSTCLFTLTNSVVEAGRFRLFQRWRPCCRPVYRPSCSCYAPPSCYGTVFNPGHPPVISPGLPQSGVPGPGDAITLKYTGGAKVKRILYAPDLMPGKKPKNLSEVREGDIILEANGQKVTSNKILLDAQTQSENKKLTLRIWDPNSKQAFVTTVDLAEPNQLVLEFDMAEAEVSVPYFWMKRPN